MSSRILPQLSNIDLSFPMRESTVPKAQRHKHGFHRVQCTTVFQVLSFQIRKLTASPGEAVVISLSDVVCARKHDTVVIFLKAIFVSNRESFLLIQTKLDAFF